MRDRHAAAATRCSVRRTLRRPAPALAALALLLAMHCAAAPVPHRAAQQAEPLPPDPEAITVYGRYQPSLESLAPPGIEFGDLDMVAGRLVIQVHADGDVARRALVRALERSGWYRDARWEPVEGGGLREGEHVLSVRPASSP